MRFSKIFNNFQNSVNANLNITQKELIFYSKKEKTPDTQNTENTEKTRG